MGKFTAYNLPLKSLGIESTLSSITSTSNSSSIWRALDVRDADLAVCLNDVVYKGDFYDLSFQDISGEVVLICDRCLDDLRFPIEAEYHIVVKYGEDYNDDNDEVLGNSRERRKPQCQPTYDTTTPWYWQSP